MKHYTSNEQTAKLIELGFEKPKSEVKAEQAGEYAWYNPAYSIGELIEILPSYIEDEDDEDNVFELAIYRGAKNWSVTYGGIFDLKIGFTNVELIDALYDAIVKLKEEGAI